MGGTAAGVTGDISSIYWNPANLARLNVPWSDPPIREDRFAALN
jgi:hypothetical protein